MKVKERIEKVVTLIGDYEYESYFGYYPTTMHIYTMKDEEGNVYVWKTSSTLKIEFEGDNGVWTALFANRWDKIKVKGTVKEFGEYKGESQVVLTRVKLIEIIERAMTKEEKQELKRKSQLESLKEGDFVYTMPYKQYKSHYSDCETLAGSFDPEERTIGVIVREGRLKASGVRFQRFSDYLFESESGKCRCIYAVSEENAWKRLKKEFKVVDDWYLKKVTPSGSYRYW